MRSGTSPRQQLPDGVSWSIWRQIDQSRQLLGKMLDIWGIGPVETPSRIVLRETAMTVKAYGDVGDNAPAILLVPAPIKRGYIWDLVPRASVVRTRAG